MSGKVAALLSHEGVSGWKPYQVDLFDGSGRLLADYRGLGVVGRCGDKIDFDVRESALIYRSVPSGRQYPFFKALREIRDSWDGSDVFMDGQGSLWILVSERIPKLLKNTKSRTAASERLKMSSYGLNQVRLSVGSNPSTRPLWAPKARVAYLTAR